jgi:toxin ParE1/3/4
MAHHRSPKADQDLDDIWLYVARQSGSLETAERLINFITDRFFVLSRYPYLGRARGEDLRPGLRSFPVGAYMIVYRIQDEDVVILRVLHGSRNIGALFR